MMGIREMEHSIIGRIILVNHKAKGPIANIWSPHVIIDHEQNHDLCERGLCQYIYVVKRANMKNIRWLNYNLDRLKLEKLFNLDFFDEFVEFFNSCYNSTGVMDRFQFIGYTPEEIIEEDFTEYVSRLAANGLLRTYNNDTYLNITPLSFICIVEDDGTIGVYKCYQK